MTLFQDVRYGIRVVRKSPGFLVAAILSLALGIGGNATIFTMINTVFLQPLQVEQLACRVSGVPSENRRIHDGLILVALHPGLPGRAARCLGDAARSWLAFNCNCQTAAAVEEGD